MEPHKTTRTKTSHLLLLICLIFSPVWADAGGPTAQPEAPSKEKPGLFRGLGAGLLDEIFGYDRKLKDVEACVAALRANEQEHMRRRAAELLGEFGDPAAVEPLIAALDDPDRSVRREAVMALGNIGDARAAEPLEQTLEAPGPLEVRGVVLYALSKLRTPGISDKVPASLRDENAAVRQEAASALAGQDWVPQGIEEQLWFHAAARNWDALAQQYADFEHGQITVTESMFAAPFRLNWPIPLGLVGRVEQHGRIDEVLAARWIAFHEDSRGLTARMHLTEVTIAARDWLLTIRLLDDAGQVLGKAQAQVTTKHYAFGSTWATAVQHDVALAFDAPVDVAAVARFSVVLEMAPQAQHGEGDAATTG